MGCRCSGESIYISENNKEKDLTINHKNDNNYCNNIINNSHFNEQHDSNEGGKMSSILKQETFTDQNTKTTFPKTSNEIKINGNYKHYCNDRNQCSCIYQNESSILKINNLNHALFNELNAIRTNPKSYILKLAKYMNNIIIKENKCLLNIGNEIYISLQSGYSAFEDAITFLSTAKSVEPFEYVKELKIDFEINEEKLTQPQGDSITSLDFIKNALIKKTHQLKGKYDIMGFHYDKSTDCAETSVILQIVDDTNSNYVRRNNIMDAKVKYVGINSCCIRENVYCYYLIFASKKTNSA